MNDAVRHWRLQRLTAIVLAPLSLWFAAGMVRHAQDSWLNARDWLSAPLHIALGIVFFLALFRHLHLGLEVVIDDYVHTPSRNRFLQRAAAAFCLLTGVVCLAALGALAITL